MSLITNEREVAERTKILTEMGFIRGNLAIDKQDKRIVMLVSDLKIPVGKVYAPTIDIDSMTGEGKSKAALVRDLVTLEMIPDIMDALRKQMDGKKNLSSERLVEEIRETNHEIALLIKGILRKRKDDRLRESNPDARG